MSRSIIIYYSLEGNTEFAALILQKKTGSDILRLKVANEPSKKGIIKFIHGGRQALSKKIFELIDFDLNPDLYDDIYLMYPVWASTYPPAIKSFLNKVQINNKRIRLIATSAGGDGNKSMDSIESLLKDNNEIVCKVNIKSPLSNKEITESIINEIK